MKYYEYDVCVPVINRSSVCVISLRHGPTTGCWGLQQTGLKSCTVSASSWQGRWDDTLRGRAASPSRGVPGSAAPTTRPPPPPPPRRPRVLVPGSPALEKHRGPSPLCRCAPPAELGVKSAGWCMTGDAGFFKIKVIVFGATAVTVSVIN